MLQLPVELQNYLVVLLEEPEHIAKISALSKHFHKLSINPITWQLLVEKKWNISNFHKVPKGFDWKLYYREKVAMERPLTWNNINKDPHPSPRQCHGAVAVGDKMLIFGGHQIQGDSFNRQDDMWYFDPKNSEFQEVKTQGVKIPPISRHRLVVIDNRVYSFGGILHNRQKLNSVYMFDPGALTWEELSVKNEPPEPRCDPVVVAYKHSIIVFGGSIKDLAFPSDIHVFDTKTRTWSRPEVKGSVPPCRIGCTAAVVRDTLYLYGGGDYNKEERKYSKLFNEMWALDLATFTWSQLTAIGDLPKICDFLNCFVLGNHIVIGGGWCSNPYAFDTIAGSWSLLTNASESPVNNNDSSAVHIGNHVYYFGGYFNNYRHHLNALDVGHLGFLNDMRVE